MATVYRKPIGAPMATGRDPLAWVMSRHVDVQAALSSVAMSRGSVAKGVLASRRSSGASEILVEHGDVDWYVTLQDHPDEHGSVNAMAIETGASGGRGGVHALGTAFPETNVINL